MFKNSGKAMQFLAKFIFGCAIFSAVVTAILLLVQLFINDQFSLIMKLLALVFLPLLIVVGGWLSSVFIYGFGVIVERFEKENEKEALEPSQRRSLPAAPATYATPASSDSEKLTWAPAPVSQPAAPAATPVSRPGAPVPPSVRPTQSAPRATAAWVCPVCDRHNSAQVLVCACGKHQPR